MLAESMNHLYSADESDDRLKVTRSEMIADEEINMSLRKFSDPTTSRLGLTYYDHGSSG